MPSRPCHGRQEFIVRRLQVDKIGKMTARTALVSRRIKLEVNQIMAAGKIDAEGRAEIEASQAILKAGGKTMVRQAFVKNRRGSWIQPLCRKILFKSDEPGRFNQGGGHLRSRNKPFTLQDRDDIDVLCCARDEP
jgi:hypothetical protein